MLSAGISSPLLSTTVLNDVATVCVSLRQFQIFSDDVYTVAMNLCLYNV